MLFSGQSGGTYEIPAHEKLAEVRQPAAQDDLVHAEGLGCGACLDMEIAEDWVAQVAGGRHALSVLMLRYL